MNNIYKLGLILSIILVIICLYMYITRYNYGTYTTTISSNQLLQNKNFYAQNMEKTRKYLQYVYPKADLTKYNDIDLARIYNSLDFYYNCCGNYNNIPLLDADCCKNTPLPYIPQGWFLDLASYTTGGDRSIYSNGENDKNIAQYISNNPQLPWGPGSGPGPFWVVGYTYIRDLFYPAGPHKVQNIGWTVDENETIPQLAGVESGSYIEVTHSDILPGMVQSQGFWMNGFPRGGTGLFYRVGSTRVANNKLDMLFKLLSDIRGLSAVDLKLPDLSTIQNVPSFWTVDYSKMNGSSFLKYWYGTDDPYLICWKYIAGDTYKSENYSQNVEYMSNGDPDISKVDTNLLWPPYAIINSSTRQNPVFLVVPSQWYTFDNANGILSVSGLMNPYGSDNVFSIDNINKPFPFGENLTVGFLDVVKYYYKLGNDGVPTWSQCKKAMDLARNNQNYYLSRVGVIVSLDEPILWLARVLGYQTLQQTNSANSNGLWQQEIIETTVPDSDWLKFVKGRIYPFITGTTENPTYTGDAVLKWMNMMASIISIRDPFNVYNDNRAESSPIGSFDTGTSVVGTCTPTYTYNSAENKPMCAAGGQWNYCKDGKAFPGDTKTGWFDPQNKKCYPIWNNIFHDKNISSHYSQISIYNGKKDI